MAGLSNYPPGVTGNELQIAGPKWESEELMDCPECDESINADAWGYGGMANFTCPECGHEWSMPEEDMYQGPEEYDIWRDMELERS